MTWAVHRAMWLALLRDPGALLMAFVMPVAFFVIFAEIFSNTSGGAFELRVAVLDETRSEESERLMVALRRDPAITGWISAPDRDAVQEEIRQGNADAGLVIRADGEPLGAAGGFGPAPLLVYSDPSSAMAGSLLMGRLQQAYAGALPELMIRSVLDLVENNFTEFSDSQRSDIDSGLAGLREDVLQGRPAAWSPADLLEAQAIAGSPAAMNHVAYYAGAIAFMFILLSAAQGALSLLDEKENGILDRIVAGPGGISVAVNGKFLYLALLGLAQTTVIFIVAWLAYGVDVPGALARWLLVAGLSSATAASIALALVTACRSRAQAQTFSTAAILVMSAVGGSMVPRFFMPGWLQNFGWLTPNTWVLEAYSSVLWRNEPLSALLQPMAMLLMAAIAGLLVTHVLSQRLARG